MQENLPVERLVRKALRAEEGMLELTCRQHCGALNLEKLPALMRGRAFQKPPSCWRSCEVIGYAKIVLCQGLTSLLSLRLAFRYSLTNMSRPSDRC
jgi:hypothetical protein